MIFIPFIQVALMSVIIGGDPKGLNIAVINHEIGSPQECLNYPLQMPQIANGTCYQEKVSCRFLNEIRDEHMTKLYYKSTEEALKDAKRLKLVAIIEFDANFSNASNFLINYPEEANEVDPDFLKNSEIDIRLDVADMVLALFVKKELYFSYRNFSEKLMESCGLAKSLKNLPMNIEMVHQVEMREYQAPGMIIM